MAKTTAVTLDDHSAAFLTRQVEGGQYGSASDVVRAGLRLLEEQEVRLRELRQALEEGEASGPAEAFDFEAFLEERAARE